LQTHTKRQERNETRDKEGKQNVEDGWDEAERDKQEREGKKENKGKQEIKDRRKGNESGNNTETTKTVKKGKQRRGEEENVKGETHEEERTGTD